MIKFPRFWMIANNTGVKKSVGVILLSKPANKGVRTPAELVEGRALRTRTAAAPPGYARGARKPPKSAFINP